MVNPSLVLVDDITCASISRANGITGGESHSGIDWQEEGPDRVKASQRSWGRSKSKNTGESCDENDLPGSVRKGEEVSLRLIRSAA